MMKTDNMSQLGKLIQRTVAESNFLFKQMPYLKIPEATITILKLFKPFQKVANLFL